MSKSRSKSNTKSATKSNAKKSTTPAKKATTTVERTFDLGAIAANPSQRCSSFGVILDATGAYKTYDSTDYVTKFKVISPNWNCDVKSNSQFKRFVHVFVYSDSASSAPRVTRVGDVLQMRNFEFKTYQNTEVKGVFTKGQSEWAVYDGRKNANMVACGSSKNIAALSGSDKETIKQLRDWSENFFAKKSVKSMNWFGRDEEDSTMDKSSSVLEIKDIDKTCKLLGDCLFVVDEQMYHKLAFADEKGRLYFSEYRGHFSGVEEGDVLKLRSVSTLTSADTRKIVFNAYSNMMLLPKKSKDWGLVTKGAQNVTFNRSSLEDQDFEDLHLDKMQKVQIGLNSYAFINEGENQTTNAKAVKQNVVKGFPILDNFEHGENDFLYQNNYGFKFFSKRGSAVLKKYNNTRYSTLKELSELQDSLNNKKGGVSEDLKYQKFLVRGFILATEYDHIFQTSKLYSPSNNRVWDVDHYDQAKKTADDLQIILHNIFYMKDQSIESEQKCFPVYLITFDGNPQYIFDLWKTCPDQMDVSKLLNMNEKKVNHFSEKMKNLNAPQYFYDMVVQLMVNNKGKVYYRVCDTIFWWQN